MHANRWQYFFARHDGDSLCFVGKQRIALNAQSRPVEGANAEGFPATEQSASVPEVQSDDLHGDALSKVQQIAIAATSSKKKGCR